MAVNDTELISEVRALTGYQADVISDPDMQLLVESAKDEILELTQQTSVDWYASRSSERALYWLVALFTKVRTGEIGGAGFTVGELEQVPLLGTAQFWLDQFKQKLGNMEAATMFGSTTVARSDRTYQYDNTDW